MAGYGSFAYYYDELNGAADYHSLGERLIHLLRREGIEEGIIADLGCGTGELALLLAERGYDMIAVDASADMLCILQDKMAQQNRQGIQLICQPLDRLDLYGTINGAIATFDTFNHLTDLELENAINRAALFLEPGGLLIFDINTAYKHREILACNSFEVESAHQEGLLCRWDNCYNSEDQSVDIIVRVLEEGSPLLEESFTEYYHTSERLEQLLEAASLKIIEQVDGERPSPPCETSQRLLIAAKKIG